jgi:hypothetical protein
VYDSGCRGAKQPEKAYFGDVTCPLTISSK